MPEGMSPERKRMIEAYGARLELTPGAGTDIDLALARMREIVAADPDRYFFPGEFENPDNPEAQEASGEEIWEQMGGGVDAVVAAQGTGGWITGVTRALKAHDPTVRAYAVEPAECPLISEQRWGTHGVPGIGDGIIPRNLDLALMDGIVTVSTAEALEMARRIAREEGMLVRPVERDERGRGAQGRGEAPRAPRGSSPSSRTPASGTCPASCSASEPRSRSPSATTRPTPTSWRRWPRTATGSSSSRECSLILSARVIFRT